MKKLASRVRRHRRVRKKINGTSERPRLAIFRSNKHLYAQIVDDTTGTTLAAASTLDAGLRTKARGTNAVSAALVGGLIAERAAERGISKVVCDRGGFRFHGGVKSLADAAREKGLKF